MARPLCPYFNKCGGCSLQHIDYSVQLENKRKAVSKAIKLEKVEVFSANDYSYRNKMDFIFHSKGVGLRRKGRWQDIIDIEKCEISNERLNSLLKEVRDFFNDCDYFNIKRKTGAFKYAVIRAALNESSISFVLNEDSQNLRAAIERIKKFSEEASAENVIVTYVPKQDDASLSEDYLVVKGKELLKDAYLKKEFYYHAHSFFQNNHEVAEKMHEYCHNMLKKYATKNAHLLDLYGGIGSFGITNAGIFQNITIIDNSKKSIEAANLNIKLNNLKNAKAIAVDARQLKKIGLGNPLFVIADPPRSGMEAKAMEELKRLMPIAIIYISCSLNQLSKDLPKFKEYNVKSAAMFDLFPQTPHIETIAEMVLKD